MCGRILQGLKRAWVVERLGHQGEFMGGLAVFHEAEAVLAGGRGASLAGGTDEIGQVGVVATELDVITPGAEGVGQGLVECGVWIIQEVAGAARETERPLEKDGVTGTGAHTWH
jgi:hypothetical protein